jgi:hypothetical protein
MAGIVVLICLYAVLGFMLAWIAGVVAREDVEVKTGVLILVLTAVIAIAGAFGVESVWQGGSKYASPFINFAALALMIRLIAKLEWKHSAIIAGIYTVLLFLIASGLRSCAA